MSPIFGFPQKNDCNGFCCLFCFVIVDFALPWMVSNSLLCSKNTHVSVSYSWEHKCAPSCSAKCNCYAIKFNPFLIFPSFLWHWEQLRALNKPNSYSSSEYPALFLVFLFLLSPFSFKLYDSEAFTISPDFYNYYQYLNLKYFHHPKKPCLGLRIYVVLF